MSQRALRGQLAIRLKYRLRYDDSLDVVAIHGVGGVVGLARTGSCVTTRPRAGPARLWSYTGSSILTGHPEVGPVRRA
jgi:ammonium transporter, Amt family